MTLADWYPIAVFAGTCVLCTTAVVLVTLRDRRRRFDREIPPPSQSFRLPTAWERRRIEKKKAGER